MAIENNSGYKRIANDLYETPTWVTDKLFEHLLKHHSKQVMRPTWEPAAGNGMIANRLRNHGITVCASDLNFYRGLDWQGLDFITTNQTLGDNIITNPPYGKEAQRFIEKALRVTWERKALVAMLLNTNFAHAARYQHLFEGHEAFASKLELRRRIVWVPRTDGIKEAPKGNHAWFIWDWDQHPSATAKIYWS